MQHPVVETEPMSLEGVGEIAFDVLGWPPIKNEALSLLSAGHKQRERVRLLLEAATGASRLIGWAIASGDIGLDVLLRAPSGRPPGDATNYLGGIGDVCRTRATRSISISPILERFKR
jgi:hypothetical protein